MWNLTFALKSIERVDLVDAVGSEEQSTLVPEGMSMLSALELDSSSEVKTAELASSCMASPGVEFLFSGAYPSPRDSLSLLW